MSRLGLVLVVPACLLLAACEPVAVALLGAGASTAMRYNLDGVASRTFTAPTAAVRSASLAALTRMGMKLDGTATFDSGEIIFGRAESRDIQIELEPITPQATRLSVTARGGSLLYDNATAVELVQQTEKVLDAAATTAATAKILPPVNAAAGATSVSTPRLSAN